MPTLQKAYENKNILVTGGTGLIGRQVVARLIDYGAIVTIVSLDDIEIDGVYSIKQDLRYYDLCEWVTRGTDYVFHLAGIKASPDITNKRPATMSVAPLQINTNVLEACRINKIPHVLFTSSIGAYEQAEVLKEENAYKGEPMDFLPGQVKRMAEYQIQGYKQEYGLDYKVVRLANCYGEGDNFDPDNGMFIPSLMAKILRGDNPVKIWGDGSAIRDFAYSGDIAQGILQIMASEADGVVNLGSGQGYSVKEVVETLGDIVLFNYEFDPSKPSGVPKRVMDISKARGFGYNPLTTLCDGLGKTYLWFNANPKEYEGRKNYFVSRRD